MITHLSITNFKSIAQIDVPLQPLTAIIGPNASGKTSILDALDLLHRLPHTSPYQALWVERHAPDMLRRGNTQSFRIAVDLVRHPKILLVVNRSKEKTKDSWKLDWDNKGYSIDEPSTVLPEQRALTKALMLQLNPHIIAKPSYSDEEQPK
jgi:predicted ATP-dependent endonuclease of OLD family